MTEALGVAGGGWAALRLTGSGTALCAALALGLAVYAAVIGAITLGTHRHARTDAVR